MKRSPLRRIALALAILLVSVSAVHAKLAVARWTLLTEEERHQLSRAEKFVEQNNFKAALPEYELFIQLYSKSEVASYAQYMVAECTRKNGQVNNAINEFKTVIDYFPESIDATNAQFSIGLCQTQTGNQERAVIAFEKVVALNPKLEVAGLARDELCQIYWRLNQRDKWQVHMEYLATGEYASATTLKNTSQRRLTTHLLSQKKIPEAYELVAKIQKKHPLAVFADWTHDALRQSHLTNIYGAEAVKAIPAIAAQAVAWIEKRAPEDTDPPEKITYDQWIARILSGAGEIDKATEKYAALYKKRPNDDPLITEYAQHLRTHGKRAEARLVYHDLRDAYVADREIAETYGEENNWKSCAEAYQKMLTKYADKSSFIQWRLGEVLQRSGRYPEAIAAFQQSQRDPEAIFRVSECQSALKQFDGAIQSLVGIANFFRSAAPEAQYRIAGQQALKGDKEAAIQTLKNVCRVHLNTTWAGQAHQDLSLKYGIDVTLGGAAKKKDE